jgi:hypothetical protein
LALYTNCKIEPLVQRVVEESPSSQGAENAVKLSAMIKLDEEHEQSEVVGDTSSVRNAYLP